MKTTNPPTLLNHVTMYDNMADNSFNTDDGVSNALGTFNVDERSNVPLWIQIRKRLIYMITSGKYKKDERLPSVRDLSVQLGVNYNTVLKVYQDLERDGFIFTKRGRGTYVSDIAEIDYAADDGEMESLAIDFVQNALGKGMEPDDILHLVREQIEKLEGQKRH